MIINSPSLTPNANPYEPHITIDTVHMSIADNVITLSLVFSNPVKYYYYDAYIRTSVPGGALQYYQSGGAIYGEAANEEFKPWGNEKYAKKINIKFRSSKYTCADLADVYRNGLKYLLLCPYHKDLADGQVKGYLHPGMLWDIEGHLLPSNTTVDAGKENEKYAYWMYLFDGITSADELVGKTEYSFTCRKSMPKLWQNSNPNSSFGNDWASVTVPLDLSAFDGVWIACKYMNTSNVNEVEHKFFPKNTRGRIFIQSPATPLEATFRYVTVSDTGVTFDKGTLLATEGLGVGSEYAIPTAIYGVRG